MPALNKIEIHTFQGERNANHEHPIRSTATVKQPEEKAGKACLSRNSIP